METLLASHSLADVLARRIKLLRLIGVEKVRPRARNRQRHVEEVLAEARLAMADGDATALKAALSSVELLSFELCED